MPLAHLKCCASPEPAITRHDATPGRATCHGFEKPAALAAGMAENTKKKFSPIPGAWAIG